MTKKISVIILFLMLSVFMTSVDVFGETGAKGDNSALLGTWKLSSAKDDEGITYTAEQLKNMGMSGEITLNKDGTALFSFDEDKVVGVWKSSNNKTVVFSYSDEREQEELTFVLEGTTLTMSKDGTKLFFSK